MVFAETAEGHTSEPVEIEIKNVAYNEAHVLNFEVDMENRESIENESDSEEVKANSNEENENNLEVWFS
jgi:hypothetical protein